MYERDGRLNWIIIGSGIVLWALIQYKDDVLPV